MSEASQRLDGLTTVPPLERSAICLVTDRLSAGFLGAYGNTWINTPCFDQLAFESMLVDQAYLSGTVRDNFYDAVLLGQHPLTSKLRPPLPSLLADAGVETLLVTDEPELLTTGRAEAFGGCVSVEVHDEAVVEQEQTSLGTFFATASECIAQLKQPTLVWLHSRGMAAAWDAPYALREAYADEEDPPPPSGSEVPSFAIADEHDPDELLCLTQAYAGQVSLWDACLGALMETINQSMVGRSALVSVMSQQGFPLGEHGQVGRRVGDASAELYNETLHLPWLIRAPGGSASALRSSALVQPVDIYDMLLGWWAIAPDEVANDGFLDSGLSAALRDSPRKSREFILCRCDNGRWAIRTPAWFMRNTGGDEPGVELYAKPDDRWEVNDVAGRLSLGYSGFMMKW